ncbi:MAG: hypothetical protein R2788_26005 [Saprospiraceae bacterium]
MGHCRYAPKIIFSTPSPPPVGTDRMSNEGDAYAVIATLPDSATHN